MTLNPSSRHERFAIVSRERVRENAPRMLPSDAA